LRAGESLAEEKRMTLLHAVVQIDHHAAKVLYFEADEFQWRKVTAHRDDTGRHGSAVRPEHEFFAEVCDSLAGVSWLLVAGAHSPLVDFRRYVHLHQSTLVTRINGWETIDHPTEGRLLALAREHLVVDDRAAAQVGRA
jgi:hypothetical protein